MNQSELMKGTLSTLILKLLEEKGRMYGYEIAQNLKELSEGKMMVKEGSLYPALHKLEADGFVTVEEEFFGKRVRRYYRLTQHGKTQSKTALDGLRGFLEMMQQMVSPQTQLGL